MRPLSLQRGLERLRGMRKRFREKVREGYEHRALPCSACPTPGICCRDAHFVNVHISRLEAADVTAALEELSAEGRARVFSRIEEAVGTYELDAPGDSFAKTYSCPLFEPGLGCLVHTTAKPLPCIAHACYEDQRDLPPDEMLESAEVGVYELNRRVYGKPPPIEPLPLAVRRHLENETG